MGHRISFVTCPKPFSGLVGEIQEAAIASWMAVADSEVILVGSATDLQTVPQRVGARTIPLLPNGPDGRVSTLPYFSEVMALVDDLPEGSSLCYLNGDVILPLEFAFRKQTDDSTLELPPRFLMTGSRWDLEEGVAYEGDYSTGSIRDFLRRRSERGEASLHNEMAMDYFVFPKGLFDEIKPLIIGRGGYDNALIAYCFRRNIPVIDCSREWAVLHQFHGYTHKTGGRTEVYFGEEAMFNRQTHAILHSLPNSLDADYCLEDGLLVKTTWRCGFLRRLELFTRFRLGLSLLSDFFRLLQRSLGSHLRVSRSEMQRTREVILRRSGAECSGL